MTKLTQITGVLILASSLTSCEKDYTCVCTNTATGNEISRTVISANSASDAAVACDERESLFTPDQCLIEE